MRKSGLVAMLAVGVGLVASAWGQSSNVNPAFVGTWKLDVGKSDFGKGPAPKSETIWITSATAGSEKWKLSRVDADGKTTEESYSGAADDKYYPITGDPDGATFAFMKDGGWAVKDKDGKVIETGMGSVSEDGKTFTIIAVHHMADGDMNTTSVFTKEK